MMEALIEVAETPKVKFNQRTLDHDERNLEHDEE